MVSTAVGAPGSAMADCIISDNQRRNAYYNKGMHEEAGIDRSGSKSGSLKTSYDLTHCQLRPRHIWLIGIGGTIGTALHVQIGHGLINGGPASLFLAFTIWYVKGLDERVKLQFSYSLSTNPISIHRLMQNCHKCTFILAVTNC